MQSTACPVKIGIYKVSITETAASTMEKNKKILYFPMWLNTFFKISLFDAKFSS